MIVNDSVIKINDLTKEFGQIKAVDNLELDIQQSEIFGLLGPNGAGKTTTVRLLTGMIKPTFGNGEVLGYDIRKDDNLIREEVGILTETSSLYERLSVRDNLSFFAKMYEMPKNEINNRIDEMVDIFDIADKLDAPAGTLSKGMRQKMAIARAIIHDPTLLFLDEPTSALAPESAKIVRDLITDLSKHKHRTIFLNTHNLPEAEKLCTRVGIIEKGKLIAFGSPNELRSILKGEIQTVFRFKELNESILDYFSSIDTKILEKDKSNSTLVLEMKNPDEQTPEIINDLVAKNISIIEIKQERPTLEKIYLELLNGEEENKGKVK